MALAPGSKLGVYEVTAKIGVNEVEGLRYS